MNNDTNTIEERSARLERMILDDNGAQAILDDELRWTCLKLLALCKKRPPAASMGSPRQMILYLTNTYEGAHGPRFERLCKGLYMMSRGRFREAMDEFEAVLVGRVDPAFELFREIALEAHAHCVKELGYDEEALDSFTNLLTEKLGEIRDHGEADHIAKLLGLVRLRQPPTRL